MRTVHVRDVTAALRKMAVECNYRVDPAYVAALERALKTEESPGGKSVLLQLIENAALAREGRVPYCQDTGVAVVFCEVGQEVHLEGGSLEEAIHEGVRQGYREGYLRPSVVNDPLRRKNTGDNTPAVVHYRIVPGDRLRLLFAAKGTGSENKSSVQVLPPAAGREGVKRLVVERVLAAGGDACPPITLGIGLGGTLEKAALLAKWALLRPLGEPSPDPEVAALEREILEAVNATGLGPMGWGGRNTCVAVHIETYACHIGALPVAINVECHAHRHDEAIL